MLELRIPERELWDPVRREFLIIKGGYLQLEHSLISLYKWEAKHKKAFLHTKLDRELLIDYIRCMTINKNIDPNIYFSLDNSDLRKVQEYMADPMTATTVNYRQHKKSNDILTAELIYYSMFCYGIDISWEKRHLNQLLMLLEVFAIKSEKPKKMSKSEAYARQRAINERNRAKYHTKG